MTLYSYILKRDYGFAPNPFPPYCTLATCKPGIRESAKIGDWIVGIGSGAKKSAVKKKLIYAMQVDEKFTFDQYWQDDRFKNKKPVMNGSKFQRYGDNIYHSNPDTGGFIQEDSHHSHPDGVLNEDNYNRDVPGKYVLISNRYWYFGRDAQPLPNHLIILADVIRNYRKYEDKQLIIELEKWLEYFPERGYIGMPMNFSRKFERYNGK